jgi:indole-3-glycerol phosphate synthase
VARIIAELKRKSPSAGQIDSTTPAAQIAMEYLEASVDAISVVTDAPSFGGSLADLDVVIGLAHAMDTPVLRKDFITDRYGVLETAVTGADGMLVLLRALTDGVAAELVSACRALGIAAVVEVAGAEDLPELARCGADIVLINARDLRDGSVDSHRVHELSGRVRSIVGDVPVVAASGIATGADAKHAADAGADAILVGTAVMRAPDRSVLLNELRSGLQGAV